MKTKLRFTASFLFVFLAMGAAALLWAAIVSGWGYQAADGDSVTVLVNKKKIPVELEGIDCPELGQEYGNEALEFTKNFIFKKKVSVEIQTYNSEDVIIGRISVDGQDLSQALVEAGLAWFDKNNSKDKTLAKAQKKAKKAKIGLWQSATPTPPWTYRSTVKFIEEKKEEKQTE